ncbi:hypothetical protein J421_5701 (plasmid) [Gemmatirosa kalamazoonensis]|uniref:Methanethiol oxidase n=1 Tax=Gemmatirosa kalamazoonensis TaxID=861299 RepID=W0RRD1_9BACT|nr:hypothetical protein [Gemmatirosa kalamazoonensis]AHG93236.1 hypothetical protein J421_5701 [Gemmatirosa kalamazoonensis]
MLCLGCSTPGRSASAHAPARYLFVWAGPHGADGAGAEDFVAVLDADAKSPTYGRVLATRAVGTAGAMAHHTELALPVGHPLFASDYETGQVFLLDVSAPLAPRVTARIDQVPGYRRPHSFARLPNGHVLATLQYGDGARPGDPGGLAEFDAAGRLLRTRSAADAAFPGARIRPNGVELLPGIDRAVTTSMPMDDERTADVVQVWRLSDLRLLHTLALPVASGDTVTHMPYDARTLPNGRSVMVNTYYCELYRLAGLDDERPRLERVRLARPIPGEGCAVTAVAGHFLIVPAATAHEVVSFDVTDAARPVEVSSLRVDSTFFPHWVGVDPGSDRLVINSSELGEPRVLLARLDRATGRLSWDARFRDAGSGRAGVSLDREVWRRAGRAPIAHAAVFGGGR